MPRNKKPVDEAMHQEASVRVEDEDGDVLAGGVVAPHVDVVAAVALVGAVDAPGGGRLRAVRVHLAATKRTGEREV